MYILVNERKIEITYKNVQRFNYDGHVLLTVRIPKESMTADQVDELCDYIKENAPAIEVYDANDEKVQTLTGFKVKPTFKRSEDGATWELNIENGSEMEFQYGLLKDRADALEKANAALVKANNDQAAVIENLNMQLLMVQLAAAELYEKSQAAEAPAEDVTEEPATESTEEPEETTEPEAAESEA